MAAKIIVLFFCFVTNFLIVHSDVLCEWGFCTEHLKKETNKCRVTPPDCGYNNATHSGLTLPSPTVCNCCEFCLPLYARGNECSLGGPGDGMTIGRCGHGLTCDEVTRTCVRMKTKCHEAQDDYDARFARGEVGAFERRPFCDGKGKYAAFDCVPTQTCFCQSEEGERLFGEVLYTGSMQNMPCRCSRFNDEIKKTIDKSTPYPVAGPRCTSDGNFNPIQCLNNTCYCVNRIIGERIGSEEINLDNEPITRLSCYEKQLDLFPDLSEGDPPYSTMSPCYKSIEEKKTIIEDGSKNGFIMDYFNTFDDLECLPDGTSGRIGIFEDGSKVCINDRSERIGDYIAYPNTSEYNNMDCKCALSLSLMSSSGSRPICCRNGNFRQIQCYRGRCRCVDSNGRQIGKDEQNVRNLKCFSELGTNWQHC
ncbi:unnamed protein product [Pieris brassicae]|uniref:Thyroglobulin type-1 domain-containing protein n=1 Tax=Pieris brassicae TaxID=7116 RepID=A0A9P0TPK2_PIEBR|nr:unnamed protein product [Pieris brassicae]